MSAVGISEIVLVVEDVKMCAAFYRDVVGLKPEREFDDAWAWFRIDRGGSPVAQRLALARGPLLFEEHSPREAYPSGSHFGVVHFALHVPREELDEMLARVRSHDVEILGPKRFEWMKATSYYFYDPVGNLVEFWSPDV